VNATETNHRATSCVVCSSGVVPHGQTQLRSSLTVNYYRCPGCGTIQSEEPYWLEQAYATPINRSDVGYISRNIRLRDASRLLIDLQFNPKGRFLDYGAGYGMFVRMMRDAGYDFWGSDAYCSSLFAPDFTVDGRPPERYELITAFEVFEHLPKPAEVIRPIFDMTDSLFFSTELIPDRSPQPGEWDYYGLDHGQHITFYTRHGLALLAESVGARYYNLGRDLHLISRRALAPFKALLCSKTKICKLYNLLPVKSSKLLSDHKAVIQKVLHQLRQRQAE